MQQLHLPPHVLAVLRAHRWHHHAERHFASHVAGFRRTHASHMLINAHPLFGDAAYAAGCINEPLEGTRPSMEMQAHRLRVRPRREQADPFAYQMWHDFAADYPEVADKLIYFVTLRDAYADGEELTACYGKEYHRAYGTANFAPPSRRSRGFSPTRRTRRAPTRRRRSEIS